jgi:hypothetical protein
VELHHTLADAVVTITGSQYVDGTIERFIHVDHTVCMTIGQARRLARALIAAADGCDEFAGYDEIEVNR